MRDTRSVSRQAHTQQYHTHIAHHSVRASPAGGGIIFAPRLDVMHVPRGLGGIHIFDIPRVLRARRVLRVVPVLRTLRCLACITLIRANRGGVVQTCRIGGPPTTCVCVCVCLCVVFWNLFFVGGDCVGGLILFAECTWGHTETSQFQGGASLRVV